MLAILLSSYSYAQAKVVLVLERRSSAGVENVGVVLNNNKISASSNSDFLFENYPIRLGLFELIANTNLKKEMLALTKKDKKKYQEVYESPHSLKVYVNGEQVHPQSVRYVKAFRLAKRVFENQNIKLKDGIVLRGKKDLEKINCESKEKNLCVFKFGYIHL